MTMDGAKTKKFRDYPKEMNHAVKNHVLGVQCSL